jgi:transposase
MEREGMRGDDQQQNHMFSYLSPEARVRTDHPLRAVRAMVDEVLTQLWRRFDTMYARVGRPSIAPEKLLRAQLLQMLYSIRSERLLMEEMDYNLLFRWFVGLNADDEVWDATTFTKNRDRLLEADVAKEFLARVVAQARGKRILLSGHQHNSPSFNVAGPLIPCLNFGVHSISPSPAHLCRSGMLVHCVILSRAGIRSGHRIVKWLRASRQ